MARVLVIGCGCRGGALARALVADGHAVRGTTRDPARLPGIEQAGAEPALADPDRLGTVMPLLDGVSVICWLMGTAAERALHGPRLQALLELIVDTPVRGLVYETGGVERPDGEAAAARAAATWRMPVEVLDTAPDRHDDWLADALAAAGRVLAA